MESKITWKEIPGFDGRYNISIYGEVHDVKRNKIINPHLSGVKRRNYHQVSLYKIFDGKSKRITKRIHSLMAITFLNHVYDGTRKYVVDHIDNNPLNNKLSNLQIVTMKVNNTKDR